MPISHKPSHQKGFTLVELMITVAIVGILSAVAYPVFTEQITRGQRAEAKLALNRLALWMERTRANSATGAYAAPDASLGLTTVQSSGGNTSIYSIAVSVGASGNGYTLTATAQGTQATKDTKCLALTLDHLGRKGIFVDGAIGYGTDAQTCWDR